LIGDRHLGWMGKAVNIVAVVATAIGVATTLGFGTIQITAGMARVFGLPGGLGMELLVIGGAFVLYMASTATGVERGIKWLSSFNLGLAALLLLAVVLLGPTGFIFETFTTSLGGYINSVVQMSLRMAPFTESTWVGDWTIFYWAWWISWSPFVGAFIARVSYGRSVREFVFGVVALPTLLGFAWFSAFGGAALWGQMFGGADMAGALAQGYETVLFRMYDTLPLTGLLSSLSILLLLIFFVTSADSAVLVLGSMSSETPGDPALRRKFAWGIAVALIAGAMLVAGGLDALQTLITVVALPFALLLVGVMVSLYRVLGTEALREKAEERRARRAIEDWIARERRAQAEAEAAAAAAGGSTAGPAPCPAAGVPGGVSPPETPGWSDAVPARSIAMTQALAPRIEPEAASPPATAADRATADGGLLSLRLERRYADRITGRFTIPGADGDYAELPADVPPALAAALRARGVSRLYRHQADAWEATRRGENLV